MSIPGSKFVRGALATVVLTLVLVGCSGQRLGATSSEQENSDGALIGVAMPNQTGERWINDGNHV